MRPPDAVFELPASSVGSVAAERFGLRCSPLSPVAFLANAHPTSSTPTALEDDARLGACLGAILQPEAVTVVRSVGPDAAVSWRALCQSRAALGKGVAAATLSPDGALHLALFAGVSDAVAWHAPAFLTQLSQATSAPLPREWPVAAFHDAFHAIDWYRRAYAGAALSGAPHGDVAVRARELVASMEQAATSDDLRWLLPAFLHLAPGAPAVDVASSASQLGRLRSAGIFRAPEGPADDPVLRYGDAGRALGLEFARGWWGAAGVEHTLLLTDGPHVMHRGFVAATACANHWLTLRTDAAGVEVLGHEALSFEAAVTQLTERLTASGAIAAMAAMAACPTCGASTTLGAGRCVTCGHALPSQKAP